MNENKYDNSVFFKKYSQMTRSKEGLKGAGEWNTLKSILPEFKDKDVLDLGCGYGWHSLWAVENGAKSVIGVDISEKMLEIAKSKNSYGNLKFIHESIEDISFPEKSFDVVISSLVFHYIENFENVIKLIYKYLKPYGMFIFSVEHPVFTSCGPQQWIKNEEGKNLYFPVDNYFYKGERKAIFLEEEVIKYHRTLTTYINSLLENDFQLLNMIEPFPDDNMLKMPEMKDEMRRPMMLIISARKNK